MGVPTVSLAGKTGVGRVGLSILSNLGLAEWVADSQEGYVRLAVKLAGDVPALVHLRRTLRQRMQQSPLMDAPRFARNVESAYRKMWYDWCKKAPPFETPFDTPPAMSELTIQQAFDLALQHHQAGRLADAEKLYRQILAHRPSHAGAMHYLGLLAHQAGQFDMAVDLIRRSLGLSPEWAEAHNHLGSALKDSGQIEEAIASYRKAIALRRDFPEAHNNLGVALASLGRLDEAIAAYRQVIAMKPNLPEAHDNLGLALRDTGQLDEAIAAHRRAIALRPNFAQAQNNLGNALKDKGLLDEAIAAYRQATDAHYNLGIALQEKGQLDAAIAAFRQAIALKPNSFEAHTNLGNALREKGQLDDAIAAYRRAIAINPKFSQTQSNLGMALKDQAKLDEAIAAYREAMSLDPDNAATDSNFVYALHFHPRWSAKEIAREHRRWNRRHAEPLRQSVQSPSLDRDPERRLKIGYVSPDFSGHVVGRNLIPLFGHHDHQQFEITCYSQVARPDELTRGFQQTADLWRDIAKLSDDQLTQQIRADRIDILVDLTLHMAHNRLLVFARKPAPLQVSFAGYPASTGLSAIDYRLSDPYLDPPEVDESIYSEKTIRLPDSFWCYDPLECRDIPVNPLPATSAGHITFGCLNNFCKINSAVLALWAHVLRRVEKSRLLLLSQEGSHRQDTLDFLQAQGIARERIEFSPHQPRRKYLELYHRIDIGLDTFPYNGHTTSLDSLWMGVPVITLAGHTPVARAGWCQLSNLKLTELAAQTPEQFASIAFELASDLPRLQQLRQSLRQRIEKSPLMDAPRFARNIESAYRHIWRELVNRTEAVQQ
jgi:predicted O-linked N-acetylglucosamine transferase (SPINDLY family)